MTTHVRRATPDDLGAIFDVAARAFGLTSTPEDRAAEAALLDPSRFLLACDDDGTVAGVTGSLPFDVTLPGGATLPVPGVMWVGVAPTHRRRGLLRALFTEQHRRFVADGSALALLTASEGGIYGRFGYGPATVDRAVEIDSPRVEFRPDVADPGGVRFLDTEAARKHAPDVHRRWCARTPGALSRSAQWWEDVLRDPERHRGGAGALFHLAHPDGYAAFRRGPGRTCRVVELFAATDDAHVALWRLLLGLDLVETVTSLSSVAIDDPLPLLLTDPRRVRTTAVQDGMWVRVLDVAVACAARSYAVELDLVLGVDDPFLDRGGRFRLRGGPEGASCVPTDDVPDVQVAMTALGPLLLGGQRVAPLAGAGLVDAAPAVLTRVDAAFAADRAPRHGTDF